jgi:hypothetical protein
MLLGELRDTGTSIHHEHDLHEPSIFAACEINDRNPHSRFFRRNCLLTMFVLNLARILASGKAAAIIS